MLSAFEYGLFGETDTGPKLDLIDTTAKAEALLLLLDKTVGSSEGSIVPHDLNVALEKIRIVAPALSMRRAFKRLSALSR